MRVIQCMRAYLMYVQSEKGSYEWHYYIKAFLYAILCMISLALALYLYQYYS